MQYDTFIDHVQDYGDIADRAYAEQLAHVVLGAFGQVIERMERDILASQLPQPAAAALFAAQPPETHDVDLRLHDDIDIFYSQVRSRMDGISITDARKQARTVIRVLQEAAAEGEINRVRDSIPESYAQLFS
ncbi:MAG: DUF2267 domain-containing protein [Chloroflexota bacterium]